MRVPIEHDADVIVREQALESAWSGEVGIGGLAAAVGVERVVEERELEGAGVGREVRLQPLELGSAWPATRHGSVPVREEVTLIGALGICPSGLQHVEARRSPSERVPGTGIAVRT